MVRKRAQTQRFKRFRREYLRTGNALQAALTAGYSRKTALAKSYRMAQRVKPAERKGEDSYRPMTARPIVGPLRRRFR